MSAPDDGIDIRNGGLAPHRSPANADSVNGNAHAPTVRVSSKAVPRMPNGKYAASATLVSSP